MYLTKYMLSYLEEAPWPMTKEELEDYVERNGLPVEILKAVKELDSGVTYDIEDFEYSDDFEEDEDDDSYYE